MIKPCDCLHKSQDELNGKGKRVYNISGNGALARCTVCGKTITLNSSEIKDSKKKAGK